MNEHAKSSDPAPRETLAATPLEIVPASARQHDHRTDETDTSSTDLDSLLVSTSIALLLVDRRLCIRRFTPAATSLFSLITADIGRPIRDLSQKFSDPDFLDDIRLVLDGSSAVTKEVRSNRGRLYLRQTLPYLLRDGKVEGAVITFSDVAADALQEARLYAEAIVDTVREPLLVLDSDLRVRSVNVAFSEQFAVSSDGVVGQRLQDIGGGEWDVPDVLGFLQEILETGVPMEGFEFTYDPHPLGARTLCLNARTMRGGGGRPDLILMAIIDITERQRIETLLKDKEQRLREEEHVRQRQLELTNALRISTVSELATGLAHELNQPLASISNVVEACTQYVRAGTADSLKLLALLAEAAAESQRAAGIVAHLRTFVEKGEPRLDYADLVDIVNRVPHLLLRELERAHVTLHIDLPAAELPVRIDETQVEQVLVNLLENAIDSIREAAPANRLIELSARSMKGAAVVSVRDTGTGVHGKAAERIFQPFFTTKPQGLGMGLALSRSILEAHRGRIWMETPNDGGPGTVMRFSVPLKAARRRKAKAPK